MADQKKLDRWAEKLLDTGKRNNLINFKDTKASSAEVVFPDCQSVFSKCSMGHTFEIFDPKLPDIEIETEKENDSYGMADAKKFTREEYIDHYSSKIKSDRYLLTYAQTRNPLTAVKNIAKKAKEMQDETGNNVAYLAFGFLKWNEKEGSEVFYRAPLLLVHIDFVMGSILDPVKIEISDDDIVVNPTFDYLLQAEHGLSLPGFQDGETLGAYYEKVARMVRNKGWTIINECKLGIFSFLKINMYEDLKKNAQRILENSNVQALIGTNVQNGGNFTAGEHVVDNPLIDLHTVVEADSSQIEAIEMAKCGKSFVLQGPPGTGKSQTITNIIAECLHDGKKILFVSEKQAALNVVYDKLKKAGLSDFCLELHSHKANKRAVIEELNRTLELPRKGVSSRAQEEIRQKEDAQNKLNTYATELHRKRNVIDLSLYQLFEKYAAERSYPELQYEISTIETKGQDQLLTDVKLLEQYAEYVGTIGQNYRENVWYGFIYPGISFDERNQLKKDLELLSQGYARLQDTTIRIKYRYETPELNFSETMRWKSLLDFSANSDFVTPEMLSKDIFAIVRRCLEQMREMSKVIIPVRDHLFEVFSKEIVEGIEGKDIYAKLTGQFSGAMSRLFNGEYKTLIAKLQTFVKNGDRIKYQQAVSLMDELGRFQALNSQFKEVESQILAFLGPSYNGLDTDWTNVKDALNRLDGYHRDQRISFGSLPEMSKDQFIENQSLFRSNAAALSDEIDSIMDAKIRVSKMFDSSIFDLNAYSYDYCIKKLQACLESYECLGNWISFLELFEQLKDQELLPFIDLIIEKHIEPKMIVGSYRKAFYKYWIEYVIFSVPEISSFSRIKQDQAVRDFIDKDRLHYEISKLQITSELSNQLPDLNMVAGGSAVAVLRREGHKKRKQMPIRKLLAETGSLVQIIKPCFLMSPLSVSTFLEPDKISFDTVIFDEASQIFPQDAIGAIYRGKQLIVVGDSRQMPPSDFFNSSVDLDIDDEEVGDVADFESVLDICSSVFDTERLTWHYRSRYEQLISFSNMHFYNNSLVTFPSSSTDHEGIGVDYYYVDGIFDRRSKTNRAEANFIVDLVYKHIEKYPDRSLGVVAFSVAQQSLIDKLLSKRRELDPSYEEFFKADKAEPFFVKNLETVQGDERDTIIFSVAYAKDVQGRFLHNFGPLNRQGGERRLNVAITRAKENVQLVSSIRYTDIDLSKTSSEGVKLLRAYLDYAQNGERALERTITVGGQDQYDSYFEQEVCDFLRDHWFTVDTQVGCSGYRIDLGIRKPDSSEYVLAVECDGATYHSSKNARDRDSLRQQVLERMGWQFYRIWSTDWYRNKPIEKEQLLRAVYDALAKSEEKQSVNLIKEEPGKTGIAQFAEKRFATETHNHKISFPEYVEVDAMMVIRNNANNLQTAVLKILESEAPLSEEYLLKRIVRYFDREKVTKTVVQEFNHKMFRCERYGIIRKNGFLYLQGSQPKLRVPGHKRDIKYISTEELADGLFAIIQQNISVTRTGLFKTLSNQLGFNRMGEAAVSRFEEALNLLINENQVEENGGLIQAIEIST